MLDTFNQYKDLQEMFKETHRAYEAQKKGARNPNDFKTRISKSEEERDQLNQKIALLHKRTADTVPAFVFVCVSAHACCVCVPQGSAEGSSDGDVAWVGGGAHAARV